MANSTDIKYKNDQFILQLLDSVCASSIYSKEDIDDCNDALLEYKHMLQYAIDVGDKREIAFIRAEMQHVKAEKREIKRMMKRMETALT